MYLLQNLPQRITDNSGNLCSGAVMSFYITGTTTPKTAYADQAGLTPLGTSVTADSSGTFPQIWLASDTEYRIKVAKSDGAVLFTWDDVSGIGASLAVLADPNSGNGDALMAVKKTNASAALATTQHAVNEGRPVDVVADFGADKTGNVGASAAIQSAVNSGVKAVFLPDGTYLFDADVTLPDDVTVYGAGKGTVLKANANGRTFFKSSTHAYYSIVRDLMLDGNGKTSVVGFDMTNFRLKAGVKDVLMRDMDTGFIARTGCFGAELVNVATERVVNPVQVLANGSVLRVENPNFDNSASIGGTGAGIGVDVRAGTGSNIGVIVNDGFIQGFDKGVKDAGLGTKVRGTYFEVCATADISGEAARGSEYAGIQHFGASGPAGVKLRNCDAVTIINPLMASGARTALYDVDNTNTNCVEYRTASSASYNVPTGSLTYLSAIPRQVTATFTPTVVGSGTAGTATYTTQSGTAVQIGSQVHVQIEVAWTGHTGTGNILVDGIPTTLAPASYTPRRIGVLSVVSVPFTGPVVYAYLNGTNTRLSLVQVSTAGAEALIPIAAAGTVRINLTYDL